MADARIRAGRLKLLAIAAIFFGPLIVAVLLYQQNRGMQSLGRANHGALLTPIINLDDAAPGSALRDSRANAWLLVYAHRAACDADCRNALYAIRQIRLMLGPDMDRVRRVFLHDDSAPDTVFLAAEHEGLVTLADSRIHALLDDKKPASLQAGGYYLVDPLGNLVMYFPPDMDPKDMVEDIEHLLELSRIG